MLLMYTKSAGTLSFSAPERLTENCIYNEKVDMWACGIVLFMLLAGQHPFDGNGTTAKLISEILQGDTIVRRKLEEIKDLTTEVKSLVC